MAQTKFRYNPKTLRYERVGVSVVKILVIGLGYLFTGVTFFVGLVFLQNFLIQTPLEKSLRAENSALKTHSVILTAKLEDATTQLNELEARDQLLYEQIFESKRVQQVLTDLTKEDILLAETSDFRNWVEVLDEKVNIASTKALNHDYYFRSSASVVKGDLTLLNSAPTLMPVENFETEKLVSGFGTRINPFHKGKYHHDGVDIAAPKGSKVLATGPGKIVLINNNNLVAGYGNYVEIDHGFGYITRYAHLDEIKVYYGQKVKEGELIGSIGMSGSTIAPHVHYEVLKDGEKLDPVRFMLSGLSTGKYDEILHASKQLNQSLD